MEKKELKNALDAAGIKYHPNLGVKKLQALYDEKVAPLMQESNSDGEDAPEQDVPEENNPMSPQEKDEALDKKKAQGVKPFYIGNDPKTGEKLYRDIPVK